MPAKQLREFLDKHQVKYTTIRHSQAFTAQEIAHSVHISGKDIAKITVSGIGLRSHTHVATLLFEQLAAASINVEMISTSELQVNAVIDAARSASATAGLRSAFAESLGEKS